MPRVARFRQLGISAGSSCLLALAIALIYGQSLEFAMLEWDDRQHLCLNPFISGLKPWAALWSQPYFGLYIPLSYTLWMATFHLAADQSAASACVDLAPWFHGLNLLLHLINSILVYRLLHKLHPAEARTRSPWIPALLGAGLFAVHPLQVEVVAWISGFRDLLSLGLALVSILLIRSATESAPSPRSMVLSCLGWLSFVLAALAKPSVIAIGLVLVWLLRLRPERRFRILTAAMFLSVGALAILTKAIQADAALNFHLGVFDRIKVALHGLSFYTQKILWPWPLVADYGQGIPGILTSPGFDLSVGLGALVLILCGLAAWRIPQSRLAWLWILTSYLPVSGLIAFGFQETSVVADRYLYSAMVGLVLLLTILRIHEHWLGRNLTLLLILGLSLLSYRQCQIWRNDQTLFTHNLERGYASRIARYNLANQYFQQGNYQAAEPLVRGVLQDDPHYTQAQITLGRILELSARQAEAQAYYEELIGGGKGNAVILNNYATLLIDRDPDTSLRYFSEASRLNPNYMEAHFNAGLMLWRKGDRAGAKDYFRRAYELNPGYPALKPYWPDAP